MALTNPGQQLHRGHLGRALAKRPGWVQLALQAPPRVCRLHRTAGREGEASREGKHLARSQARTRLPTVRKGGQERTLQLDSGSVPWGCTAALDRAWAITGSSAGHALLGSLTPCLCPNTPGRGLCSAPIRDKLESASGLAVQTPWPPPEHPCPTPSSGPESSSLLRGDPGRPQVVLCHLA